MWGINLGRKRLAGHVGRADGGLRIMMRRRKESRLKRDKENRNIIKKKRFVIDQI